MLNIKHFYKQHHCSQGNSKGKHSHSLGADGEVFHSLGFSKTYIVGRESVFQTFKCSFIFVNICKKFRAVLFLKEGLEINNSYIPFGHSPKHCIFNFFCTFIIVVSISFSYKIPHGKCTESLIAGIFNQLIQTFLLQVLPLCAAFNQCNCNILFFYVI